MIESRSMISKTIHQVPQITSKTWITTSKRPESSFFLCLSISILEILIKFKSTYDYFPVFTTSLNTILRKVCAYTNDNSLNSNILTNYSEIIELLKKTSSKVTAFNYLNFYSESNDYNCFITLEYSMRFILASLFSQEDKAEEQRILKDNKIENYLKALELLSVELPVTVILIENQESQMIFNKAIEKQPNIFLMKREKDFAIVYPEEFYLLFEKSPKNSKVLETFPFISLLGAQSSYYSSFPVLNSKHSDTFSKNEENLNSSKMIEFSTVSHHSRVLDLHKENDQNDLIEDDSNISIKSTESDTLIEISLRRFRKVLNEFNKRFKIDLIAESNSLNEKKRKRINISDIKKFFIKYLPIQRYSRKSFKKFCRSLHKSFKSTRIQEEVFWAILVNSGIDPMMTEFSKSGIIKGTIKIMKYLLQMKLQCEVLIGN